MLLGLWGQWIALIKGGPKHHLKSTLVRGRSWNNVPIASSVCVNARWSDMPCPSMVLNSILWETEGVCVDEFLPSAWQSMWNGESSAHKDKSTRAQGWLKMTCDVSNEFTAAKSHCTNDLVDHVRFTVKTWWDGVIDWGTLHHPREERVTSTSNYSLHCTIFTPPKS